MSKWVLEDGWRDRRPAGGVLGHARVRHDGCHVAERTSSTFGSPFSSSPYCTVRRTTTTTLHGVRPPRARERFSFFQDSALFVFLFSRLSVLLPPALRLLRLRFASLAAAEEREDAHQALDADVHAPVQRRERELGPRKRAS